MGLQLAARADAVRITRALQNWPNEYGMSIILTVSKCSFWTCGKDTPNTAKHRDMTFTSAARFLILDLAFPLRAVLSHCRSAPRLPVAPS